MPMDVAARRFGLTVSVAPDTVTVGQPFTATVGVRVPAALAASVQFPEPKTVDPDVTTSDGGVRRNAKTRDGLVEATATYRIVAWDVGRIPIGLGNLVIGETRVDLSAARVVVRSVFRGSAVAKFKARPQPARKTFPVVIVLRQLARQVAQDRRFVTAAIGTLGVLSIVGALWLFWRRTRRWRELMAQLVWAEREFARIEKLRLLEKGEPERYSILMTTVVRQLLSRQFPNIPASATTSELVARLEREPMVPAKRTLQLLERVDVLKFARRNIEVPVAQTIGSEDRAVVRAIKERWRDEIAEKRRTVPAEQPAAAGGKP